MRRVCDWSAAKASHADDLQTSSVPEGFANYLVSSIHHEELPLSHDLLVYKDSGTEKVSTVKRSMQY